MKGKKTEWTAEMDQYLRDNYSVAFDKDMAKRLCVSVSSMLRRARTLGLERKGKEFVSRNREKIQEKAVCALHAFHKAHPEWMPSEVSVNAFKKHSFKKGYDPKQYMTDEQKRKRVENSAKSRKEKFRRDRIRRRYGLEPISNMHNLGDALGSRNRGAKYMFVHRYGYISKSRYDRTLYYDENTDRHLEQKWMKRYGCFKFEPLNKPDANQEHERKTVEVGHWYDRFVYGGV